MISSTDNPAQQYRIRTRTKTEKPVNDVDDLGLADVYRGEEVLPTDIGQRARGIAYFHKGYTWEFISQTLHQLLLSRMPLDQIAKRFNVNVRTIMRWRDRMREELRQQATKLQPRDLIMESYASLQEVRASAWREYYSSNDRRERSQLLTTAMKAETEILRLGQMVGLFDDAPMKPTPADISGTDEGLGVLGELARSFLTEHKRMSLTSQDRIIDEDEDDEGDDFLEVDYVEREQT
jgi:hypothetical protein